MDILDLYQYKNLNPGGCSLFHAAPRGRRGWCAWTYGPGSGSIETFRDSLMSVEGTYLPPFIEKYLKKCMKLLICHYLNKEGLCHCFMYYYNEFECAI